MSDKNMTNMQNMQSQMDPELTLDVKNPEVELRIRQFNEKKTQENFSRLVDVLRNARLLVPASPNEETGQPVPILLQRKDGEAFFPVYTEKKEIPKEPKCEVAINMSYRMVSKLVTEEAVKCGGIVINPFTDSMVFRMDLVRQIEEMGESEVEDEPKSLQLTEEEYLKFERRQFEYGFLPKTFFEKGKDFLEELSEKKAAYLDALFEESYQQKRLYPYLEEEFSVMVMNISEELRIVRADLPSRDRATANCYRVYFSWDVKNDEGRYFVLEKGPEQELYIGEIAKDWAHLKHGKAPAEGAELARILELIQGE